MKGAVFTGNRTVELLDFPDPEPGPGEVVLEIKASGMCGSDLKFYRAAPGEMQRALGLGDVTEPIVAGHTNPVAWLSRLAPASPSVRCGLASG